MTEKEFCKGVAEHFISKVFNPDIQVFDTPNWAGDKMVEVFKNKHYKVLLCPSYGYLELLEITEEEQI